MSFGDLQWATTRAGRVSRRERLGQAWQVVRLRLARRLRRAPAAVGARSAAEAERMLAEIELPSTAPVERAAALVSALGPAALAGHAMRTFAWGALLGLRDGLVWDREAFALAALLHDLALARRDDRVACFAADGAIQAARALEAWGVPPAVRATVADAVCLHLRVAVPRRLGVEAHLVHAGAGLDVIGLRARELAPALRQQVLARHPRGPLKEFLTEALRRDAQAHPGTRLALWMEAGLADRIRHAPFDT